ncbi:uncharacterized protein si:ch211-234p6.5 isoform X1 [Anguilla anguilla]|uniref:uncharacterized protein si:ch211-234p6.5 isoform X1 n=1 Tax=Anguilla anguilla TaxID=7936 RepID=UPI0015B08C47|nr:uncharacterized protein si:ch211-234p6.5 isoform X1 [Anguilla anguilla]
MTGMEQEKESTKEWKRLVRMNEQDRVSQASSLATISAFPVHGKGSDGKVQTFGKRARAVKRDPNCPVVIRGWLYKQDSSGLKLWKRRWFVLSDFCLFYYKDSREESVLGSIPLPSYNILFCAPRECKHRKYAFKAVHQGMRSYVFSADTQEDMLGWVRALSQSANMEMEGSLNRRCSSYQDFTRIGGSSESLALPETPSVRNGPTQMTVQGNGSQNESSPLVGGRMGTPQLEHRGRQKNIRQSPSPRTSTATNLGGHRRRGQSLTQETAEQDTLPLNYSHQTPPQTMKSIGPSPLTPRSQLGSRPHTPVGRVDIRPQDDPLLSPQSMGSAPPSPKLDFSPCSLTPTTEKRHTLNRPIPGYSSLHPISTARRAAGKACSPGGQAGLLPPLPPPRIAPVPPPPHHHHHHRSHMSVCLLQPAMVPAPATSDLFQERDQQMRTPESEVDAVLTRLCGCDKLLQSLSIEMAELQADKDNVQCALEMARLQLEEWKGQGFRGQGVRGQEGLLSQKALLQDNLVTIRARMCDVSMEMERVWCQYERMESELSVLRSHLQHICRFGRPQEQSQAQRELWMMEDILCGLKANRNHFRNMLRLPRQIVASPILQKSVLHPGAPGPQTDGMQNDASMGVQSEPPPRPPLPQELQGTNQDREVEQGWLESESELEGLYSGLSSHHRSEQSGESSSVLSGDRKKSDNMPGTLPGLTASNWSTPDTTVKRVRMSEEEQRERMKRNQERLANQKKAPTSSPTNHSQSQRPSPPKEEPPFPLRVTRVLTAVLPSALVARRVSVEDPPYELATPLPEQISPGMHQLVPDQNRKSHRKHRELFLEKRHQNSNRVPMEVMKDGHDQSLAFACQEPSSEMTEQKSNLPHTSRELPNHQHTAAIEDDTSLFYQKSPKSSTSEMQGATEKSILPEASSIEPEISLRQHRCDWSGSGNGSLHSDLRSRDENGCSAFTGSVQANGRREKVGGRASFLVSDLEVDPDLCLTPEQRDAKLRRVERIRARVIRSAVRESNVRPNSPQTGDNIERLMKHSFTLPNNASKRQMAAGSGDSEEYCCVQGVDCDHCCHSYEDPDLSINVTTEPHPARVPPLNVIKVEGSTERENSVLKKCTQRPLKGHRGDTDVSSWHHKGVPQKNFLSSNHTTKLTVFPTNNSLESTQEAGNSRPFQYVTKKVEEVTGNRNETPFLPTNRRAEWFLSTNQMVKCIPLINPNIKSVTGENATSEDHNSSTCDFTIQHTVTDATSESLLSAAKQSADSLEEDALSTFPEASEQGTQTNSTAIHTSSPKNLPKHNYNPDPIKLANETKESDHPDSDITEELTLFASQKELPKQTTIKCEEPQNLVSALNKQQESPPNSGYDTANTEDCNTPECLTKQITPYATINFDAARGSLAEANTEVVLSSEPQDPQLGDQNVCPALCVKKIPHSSPKSTHELHIYEEIAYGATLRDNQSQECPVAVKDLPSSNPLSFRYTEHIPISLPGHSAFSSQSAETLMETGNGLSTEVQTESEGTSENLELSERKGKEVCLRRDQANLNSKPKNGNDNQSSPFIKARVTVVRTSL